MWVNVGIAGGSGVGGMGVDVEAGVEGVRSGTTDGVGGGGCSIAAGPCGMVPRDGPVGGWCWAEAAGPVGGGYAFRQLGSGGGPLA